jgi:hypothetical protein
MEYQPQKEDCVLKAPALKNFYCSQAGGVGYRRRIAVSGCMGLIVLSTAGQTPFVYEKGDCLLNRPESTS